MDILTLVCMCTHLPYDIVEFMLFSSKDLGEENACFIPRLKVDWLVWISMYYDSSGNYYNKLRMF